MANYSVTITRSAPTPGVAGTYTLGDVVGYTSGGAAMCSAVDGPSIPVASGMVPTTLLTLPAGAALVPSSLAVPDGTVLEPRGQTVLLRQPPTSIPPVTRTISFTA